MHVTPEDWSGVGHVEAAYREAIRQMDRRNERWAEIGWIAAQRRDEKLLVALEKAAEAITKFEEHQRGLTRRFAERLSERVETTETQLFRAAYETLARGQPIENLKWIYGAGAWLCGYNCHV